MKRSRHKLLREFVRSSLLQEKGMIDKVFGSIDSALGGAIRGLEKKAAQIEKEFEASFDKADTSDVKPLPGKFDPTSSLNDQIYAVTTTLQLVGYSVKFAKYGLESTARDIADLEGSENPLEGYEDVLDSFAERMGTAVGYLHQDDLKKTSTAVTRIVSRFSPGNSPSELADALSELYVEISNLDLSGNSKKVIEDERAKALLEDSLSWANKYIQEGLRSIGPIDSVASNLRSLAEKLRQFEELIEASKNPGEAPQDAVSGTVFESRLRLLIREHVRNQ